MWIEKRGRKKGFKHSEVTKIKIGLTSKGRSHSEKTKKKMAFSNTGKKNSNWKGDSAGIKGIHSWIRRSLKNPRYCEICKRTDKKMYHWSNKDHKYRRVLSDWQRLCAGCHLKYDYKYNGCRATKQKKLN